MTMEEVLRLIKQKRGTDALSDENLIGLFQDFSKNQLRPQANALKVFLDCQGNTRILNLQNATAQERQVQFHRLVQEMVAEYNMQEETVAEVCSTFWRVALETDPPAVRRNEKQNPLPPPIPSAPVPVPSPVSHAAQERFGEITAKAVLKDANARKPCSREGAQKVQRQKRKKRQPFLSTRTGAAIIILWVFSSIIAVCVCKTVSEEFNSFDGIYYLFVLLMLAEFYLVFYAQEKVGKLTRPYIVPVLNSAVLLIALSYAHSKLADGYQFVTVFLAVWAALTILTQILMIRVNR